MMSSSSLNLLHPHPNTFLHLPPHRPPSTLSFTTTTKPLTRLTVRSTRPTLISSSLSQTLTRNPNPLFPSSPKTLKHKTSNKHICKASSTNNQTTQIDVTAKERIISAIAYHVPFLNGLGFGIFLLERFPILELAFDPIVPLFSFYKSLPFHNIVAFVALCFGVARDKRFSRFVRRNALQATMVDVLLALPTLLNVVLESSHEGVRFQMLQVGYSGVFVVICLGFLYAVWGVIRGKTPRFPFITDAVDWQIYAVDRM